MDDEQPVETQVDAVYTISIHCLLAVHEDRPTHVALIKGPAMIPNMISIVMDTELLYNLESEDTLRLVEEKESNDG